MAAFESPPFCLRSCQPTPVQRSAAISNPDLRAGATLVAPSRFQVGDAFIQQHLGFDKGALERRRFRDDRNYDGLFDVDPLRAAQCN